MYKIKVLNKISKKGLSLFEQDPLYEMTDDGTDFDGILVRSADMHEMELPASLKAIARAGAGVNNIPVEKCTERGIVVFNTPGANANGVKELVIASLFLSSRKIYQGINWVQSLKGRVDNVADAVEKEKSKFEGPEVKGKRLGVIGLGAIGAMVANDAVALGMEVLGHDPYISVDSAWSISRAVKKAPSLEYLLATSDYITLHIPLNKETKGFFNREKFSIMKKGARLINLARGGLVVNSDLLEALDNGTLSCYVTDFPDEELLGNDKIITIPHLGASTPESEDNCAYMAAVQLKDFLEKGNIRNSVNFPDCVHEPVGEMRLITAHRNIPNMVGQVTTILAENRINIADMMTRHKNGIGYNMIDVEGEITDGMLQRIKSIDGILMARVISNRGK